MSLASLRPSRPSAVFPCPPAAPYQCSLNLEGNAYVARALGYTISSHFQPILSVAHQRVIGHEALMRAHTDDGTAVSPLAVFGSRDLNQTVQLDRLGRAVHLNNFLLQSRDSGWLFLNVNPQVAVASASHGRFFAELLRRHEMPFEQVVVEIMEGAFEDHARLVDAVACYRELGCLIALDDFGAGHSNFDRVWRMQPDIVKLDRSMITQAAADPRVRRVMPFVVQLLHEAGSLVLMEGIETAEEATIALDSDVDFVQGYLFGRPEPTLCSSKRPNPLLPDLWRQFRGQRMRDAEMQRANIAPYSRALTEIGALLERGVSLEAASACFLALPHAERCYLLNASGVQVGNNISARGAHAPAIPSPLSDSHGAIWFHRHYFRSAMDHPGEVQITRPYLSVTGTRNCVTLSCALHLRGEKHVVCGDLDWA